MSILWSKDCDKFYQELNQKAIFRYIPIHEAQLASQYYYFHYIKAIPLLSSPQFPSLFHLLAKIKQHTIPLNIVQKEEQISLILIQLQDFHLASHILSRIESFLITQYEKIVAFFSLNSLFFAILLYYFSDHCFSYSKLQKICHCSFSKLRITIKTWNSFMITYFLQEEKNEDF